MNTTATIASPEALHAKVASLIAGDDPFCTAPPAVNIASIANRTAALAAIGTVLPEVIAGGPQATRVVCLHGPCALPVAVAVDQATAGDRRLGKPAERWNLVVLDADADPAGIFARRASRTVVLACSKALLPGHPAVLCA